MKKIEKIDRVTGLGTTAQVDRSLVLKLLDKVDELVDRVNWLNTPFVAGRCDAQDIGKAAPRRPRPRYLPHGTEG